jgi:hypothetical protein
MNGEFSVLCNPIFGSHTPAGQPTAADGRCKPESHCHFYIWPYFPQAFNPMFKTHEQNFGLARFLYHEGYQVRSRVFPVGAWRGLL